MNQALMAADEKVEAADETAENSVVPESSEISVHQYPVPIRYGQIVNDPALHKHSNHLFEHAVDIACPPETPVFASKSGVVLSVKNDGQGSLSVDEYKVLKKKLSPEALEKKINSMNNHIIIEHSDGTQSVYIHLQKNSIALDIGDQVKAGERIATTGLVGVMSEPHLHFHVQRPSISNPLGEAVPIKLIHPETKKVLHESIPALIQTTTERYQKLVNGVLDAKPDIVKNKISLTTITHLLNRLNSDAPIDIKVGTVSGQKFNVALVEQQPKNFPKDRLQIWENGLEEDFTLDRNWSEKNISTLQITLSHDFALADLPFLLAEIQALHTQQLQTNPDQSLLVENLLLTELQKITAFYQHFGQKINEFAAQKNYPPLLTQSLEVYSRVCETLGEFFSIQDGDILKPPKQSKWLTEVCWPRTRAILDRTFADLLQRENFSWEAFLVQFDQEVLAMITEQLNTAFESSLFERAQKEFLRTSDTVSILEQNLGVFQFEKSIGGKFPTEWKQLSKLKSAYKDAKKTGDITQVTSIEKKVADTLSAVVFCSNFWTENEQAMSLAELGSQKKISEANRSEVFHQAFRYFLGLETWTARTSKQCLSILPLSDGRWLALAEPPYVLANLQKTTQPQLCPETQESWLVLHEHQNIYQSEQWNSTGVDFQSQRKWAEAEYCFRQALKLVPQNPMTHNNLGIVFYQQKKFEEAQKHLEKALSVAPAEPNFLNAYGHYLHRIGQAQNAFEYFRLAVNLAPTDAYLKSDYAYSLQGLGEDEKALLEWEEAANLDPHDLDLVLTYTDALQRQGKTDIAIERIETLLAQEKFSNNAEIYGEYGLMLDEIGDINAARRAYEMSLTLDPKNVYIWDKLHLLLEKNASFSEVEHSYQQAIHLFPSSADLVNNYAFYLKQNDINDEAEIYFKKAIKMQPMNATYRNNYALLLEKLQRTDEAEIQYEQTLGFDPDNPIFVRNAANFFEKKGDIKRVETLFKQAAELVPEQIQYLTDYTLFLEKNNRFEESQELYQAWIKKFPEKTELRNNLAVSFFESGNYEAAYETGLIVFSQKQENPIYADNLCSFILEGNLEQASEKFDYLLETYPDNVVFANCAVLVSLMKGDFAMGETLIHALLKKYPDNAYTFMNAANFYDQGFVSVFLGMLSTDKQKEYIQKYFNPEQAIKFYTAALESMQSNRKQVPINADGISIRITELQSILPK